MVKVNKTLANPGGLTVKQWLMIEDIIRDIKNGKGIFPMKSARKFYRVKNDNSAYQIAHQNLSRLNFRKALLKALEENNIIGQEGKIGKELKKGLNATYKTKFGDIPDYKTRLEYIKEINKICGLY
ncbi:hypothetical protein COT75_02385 [Candidatus Beckwithbacteria bacterium CG10_big_fil_rev_8_21_14_0_10_34_10]|uniref:Uncharacterized protein n=1 Tax=Candidatus Beckwithbacteria bacterium CG10_big_fil_rev_8_21_14_0_10_34_10 TaxID=1974495 RepID=A0A2H0W9D0_9BACT|nr:MAG: hypothetical protein COT75_02385 [Candidatus Beckwithbacteria bacterium CG10_big_fil_rev_8_21_14_0_10_34_10]